MNFVRDVVWSQAPESPAMVELGRDGTRRVWSFGEVSRAAGSLAAHLQQRGVGRGDVVMTLIGNRSEWVLSMLACFQIGAVVLPCSEQLTSRDIELRLKVAAPQLVITDERNLAALTAAAPDYACLTVPDHSLLNGPPAAIAELSEDDPCLMTFTSGTQGEPKAVLHLQRYLTGQALQAEHWLDVQPGETLWCTGATGWSKSARNVFIGPWLRGAVVLLHDARFDPEQRLELIERERVNVLCMAPTEYRIIAKRAVIPKFPVLRNLVAAGEALNPEVISIWETATGLQIRDGYGQTETGQLTGAPNGQPVRPGSMGTALPGVRLWIDEGELVADPESIPTFFHGYLGQPPADRSKPWRTGDLVQERDGWFYFQGRADDLIVSAGYRIGPFEVESALVSHPSVAEAAVVSAPDPERGEIVRAVVVLRDGCVPGPDLVRQLQEHVKAQTAPYKYPRQIEFVAQLPRTASGKVRRALLRGQ